MDFKMQNTAESTQTADFDSRKRAMPMLVTSSTQTDTKKPKNSEETPQVENNGWGPLFKDRDTFVEMHIC